MRKLTFYPSLAFQNIRKNKRFYSPYLLACILCIMMTYIMFFIASNNGLLCMPGSNTIALLMGLGSIIVLIFSACILFYTNGYLMKQRQKELGLYSILGMGKDNLSIMLLFESFFIGIPSFIIGLFSGILYSRLTFLILQKILNYSSPFELNISFFALGSTTLFFSLIFLLILIYNLINLRIAKPIELSKGSNIGEKEVKTKLIRAILGILFLGIAYYIALSTTDVMEAIFTFFIAVILVIFGTYLLFEASSIALLKFLKKNKNYYYKQHNFLSISTLMYRMKQSARGLANICILSTMVIVMVSGTVALYAGMNDIVNNRLSYDAVFELEDIKDNREIANNLKKDVYNIALQSNTKIEWVSIDSYFNDTFTINNNHITTYADDDNLARNYIFVTFLSIGEYNHLYNENIPIKNDHLYIQPFENSFPFDTIKLNNLTYNVEVLKSPSNTFHLYEYVGATFYYILVPDYATLSTINQDFDYTQEIVSKLNINLQGTTLDELTFYQLLKSELMTNNEDIHVFYSESKAEKKISIQEFCGGFLFLGIFLGIIFTFAMILIMYYKQIVEGYDDKERFKIMRQVGLSEKEIKKTINSQVIKIFFLPLIVAFIHYAFAFPIICLLLKSLAFTNTELFFRCSILTCTIFALIYSGFYVLTARTYYNIIS